MGIIPLPAEFETIGLFWTAAAIIAGYILGSIPFGLIFTKLGGYGDVRSIGSGNTGATNVLRTGNKKLAALTLICDALKGALPALAFMAIAFNLGALAGFCAFIGHIFPIWLKFKGGKGVATYLGVILALRWELALLFGIIWAATAFISRYSSLSALAAAFLVPFISFFLLAPHYFPCALIAIMSAIIFIRHKGNIMRLLNGTESAIGRKNSANV